MSRTFHAGDPEPPDRPYLQDNRGNLWVHITGGWWSPYTLDIGMSWGSIWHPSHGITALRTLTAAEVTEVDRETFS